MQKKRAENESFLHRFIDETISFSYPLCMSLVSV